ncbi:hypothetical protein VPH35_032241 [Triticum aestivum]
MRLKRYRKNANADVASLPVDILANIHGRLSLLDRLAFAAIFHAWRGTFKSEAPWLLLRGRTPETATLFSLSDRCTTTVCVPEPALHHHVQRTLPAITTMPCLVEQEQYGQFVLDLKHFVKAPPHPVYDYRPSDWTHRIGAHDMCAKHMRSFCRKVILSNCPPCPAAMMITGSQFGFTVCGTTPSPDGIEDAIHYEGRFYSITYSGQVKAREHDTHDAGVFRSMVVAPRLLLPANLDHHRYLVVALGRRLTVVAKEATHGYRALPSFKVHVLDTSGEEWRETDNIGDVVQEHPELKAGCVYYASEGYANDCAADLVRVFSLKDGKAGKVEGLGRRRTKPRPVWFSPCIP